MIVFMVELLVGLGASIQELQQYYEWDVGGDDNFCVDNRLVSFIPATRRENNHTPVFTVRPLIFLLSCGT